MTDARYRAVAAAVLAGVACLLWPSAAGPQRVAFDGVLLAVAVAGVLRPLYGMAAGALVLPLATGAAAVLHAPFGGVTAAEAIAEAVILGISIRWVVAPERRTTSLDVPAAILALLATASYVQHALAGGSLPPIASVVSALGSFGEAAGRPPAALRQLLLGLALMLVAARLGRDERRRVFAALLLGLAGAAAMNVTRFAEVVAARATSLSSVVAYVGWLRVSTEYPDVNAAGSAFALALLGAIGFARQSSADGRRRTAAAWWLAVVAFGSGLWLSGSRTAFAAVVIAAPALRIVLAGRAARVTMRTAAVLAAAILAGGLLLARTPRTHANIDPGTAIAVRVEMLKRGMRMAKAHPVGGVGVGRFYDTSVRYASPGSPRPQNAHNNYVQILAELGVPGLVAFLWILWRAAGTALPAARTDGRLAFWTVSGLFAYLLTCVGGHPLLEFGAAVPLWLALGIAAGGAPARRHDRLVLLVSVIVVLLALPLGVAASRQARHPDATNLGPWRTDRGHLYRPAGHGFLTYIAPNVRTVVLPARLDGVGPEQGVIDILVDGTLVNSVSIGSEGWQNIRIPLPRADGYADRKLEVRLHGTARVLLVGRPTLQ